MTSTPIQQRLTAKSRRSGPLLCESTASAELHFNILRPNGSLDQQRRLPAQFLMHTLDARRGRPLKLAHGDSAEAIFLHIARNCVAQISGNERRVVKGTNPESVHQLRVGLRCLRSALDIFRPLLVCPPALQSEQTGAAYGTSVAAAASKLKTVQRMSNKPWLTLI
ncbi:CHAD domain-containing protein [Cupriavidus sp. BIC8F]|uniref:CHAD domain-containing protein n=1 Tax=Cupriavidus sp. BIC8F TaxID=3079014 RepID=UPI002916E3CF|nr:CHAD domain-containing protein [Cupriavidus sp. BIC8F]